MPSSTPRKRTYEGTVKVPNSARKIIAAIDFGTTFSGIAYAYTHSPEDEHSITTWPNAISGALEGETHYKAPTVLRYDNGKASWGFLVPLSEPHHKWFKLELDAYHRHKLQGVSAMFLDPSVPEFEKKVPAEKKVTDYLKALRNHLEDVLRCRVGATVVSTTPIEYVLTVPAIWSESAQSKTRSCAERAGMGLGRSLYLISEPEAAAIHALKATRHIGWKVKDTFVVVDAGGGTVDLISYRITRVRPSIKLVEATAGTGHFCGSAFIDKYFQDRLLMEFENDPNWDDEILNEAMEHFRDKVKPKFMGASIGQEFKIPVPGLENDPDKGILRGKWAMPAADVEALFERVVSDIISLVLGQINSMKAPATRVLLVGGLGQSSYLRERIRAEVGTTEVLQPQNGCLAVVMGALMRGLESVRESSGAAQVEGRVARKHYGLEIMMTFKPGIHDETRKKWYGYAGEYCNLAMDWFLRKGDTVEEEKPVILEYYRARELDWGPPSDVSIWVLVCSDPNGTGAPIYKTHRVKRLVEIKADLSKIPNTKFPISEGKDGKSYIRVDFEIHITYHSGDTSYELVHDGVNYGAVKAEYV